MCAISVGGTTGTHLPPLSAFSLSTTPFSSHRHSLAVLLGSFILQSGDTPKRCPGQMTNGPETGEAEEGKQEERGQKEARQNSCTGTLCSDYWQYAKFAICHARRQSLQAQCGLPWPGLPCLPLCSLYSPLPSFFLSLLCPSLCFAWAFIRFDVRLFL